MRSAVEGGARLSPARAPREGGGAPRASPQPGPDPPSLAGSVRVASTPSSNDAGPPGTSPSFQPSRYSRAAPESDD